MDYEPFVILASGDRNDPDRIACERLRHHAYPHEPHEDGRERDQYDSRADYIGVRRNGLIVACCRVVRVRNRWEALPLHRELRSLQAQHPAIDLELLRKELPDSEISRCINLDPKAAPIFYRTVCHYLEGERISRSSAVVRPVYHRKLAKEFPDGAFIARTPEYWVEHGGKRFDHTLIQINVREWGKCFPPCPILRYPLAA